LAEAVAVAVHFEDVDVVGQPIEQRAGEALGAEDLGGLPIGLGLVAEPGRMRCFRPEASQTPGAAFRVNARVSARAESRALRSISSVGAFGPSTDERHHLNQLPQLVRLHLDIEQHLDRTAAIAVLQRMPAPRRRSLSRSLPTRGSHR